MRLFKFNILHTFKNKFYICTIRKSKQSAMVVHIFNPNTQETKVGKISLN